MGCLSVYMSVDIVLNVCIKELLLLLILLLYFFHDVCCNNTGLKIETPKENEPIILGNDSQNSTAK
jgi:hypothetical protein